MKKSSRWKTMILTGAFVLALNCGNVFASEAGMTGESNTEATIVEENGAADNVQNPADSQVVNDQNGNSYSVNSADVPESGDPAVEPTEPPADPPAEILFSANRLISNLCNLC